MAQPGGRQGPPAEVVDQGLLDGGVRATPGRARRPATPRGAGGRLRPRRGARMAGGSGRLRWSARPAMWSVRHPGGCAPTATRSSVPRASCVVKRASTSICEVRTPMAIEHELRDSQVTPWTRRLAPMREYVATENASAAILLAATVAALVWANSPWSDSYERLWDTEVSLSFGSAELALDLRALDQRRAHGVLLLRRGARDPPRVRHGRAAGAAPRRHPGAGGDRRHGGARPHLSGHQRRGALGPGLGHRHGHRHRVRPGRPHAGGRGRRPGCGASCSRW